MNPSNSMLQHTNYVCISHPLMMTYGSETCSLTMGLIRRLRVTERAMERMMERESLYLYVIKSEMWRSVVEPELPTLLNESRS
ncbi:jg6737 [Pararge aegeria aegeria]|uniref:Jg6737 protein n=1 Tax=Pararge aegeria aegeria TaxID=348720 RepID=A0A8S4R0B3_9NEOP|nr:jg6737 [Pararge aegeria aegeria]